MTYNVFGGTLSLAQSVSLPSRQSSCGKKCVTLGYL